jgi:hypothetical protein
LSIATERVLAAASGSDGGLGKITTIPASGVLYVRCGCGDSVKRLDWNVKCDKACVVQLYRTRSIVESVTLTLASLVDGETLVINGLTYTAEDTAGDCAVATRKFYTGGADDTADATALTALINDADSGALGFAATSALGVVTLVPTTAPTIQAATGTAGGHCTVASTTLTGLVRDGAATTVASGDTTTAGVFYEQDVSGWPYAYLGLTNSDGAAAATVTVKATPYSG